MQAQREGRGIAVLILNLDIKWMVNPTFRPFYSRKAETVTISKEAGWTPGPVWTGVEKIKFLPRTGVRIPSSPANNDSLYRLRYPGPCTLRENHIILCIYRFHTYNLKKSPCARHEGIWGTGFTRLLSLNLDTRGR
jgi:hypothetical protein